MTNSRNKSDLVLNPEKSNGVADQMRMQFEGLHRQAELASDMDCFRPGGQLSLIRYIAHPHSPHVARWVKILSHTQAHVTIETANPVPAYANEFVEARPLVTRNVMLPMGLRYLLSGLYLRFTGNCHENAITHAHSASGNGFVAWLSGRKYLIGTYGSEIYGAKHRGALYRWILKRILHGAERISVCSTECTKILTEQFGVPEERIYRFHLGYDDMTFRPLNLEQRKKLRLERKLPTDEPIWVVNRRTHPHYRTQAVVQGFLDYCQTNSNGRLVLLCGDHDPNYTKTICQIIDLHKHGHRITVVRRMLPAAELASWLQLGDFSFSVPKTDNFSLSTLESLGCAAVPIFANLIAYDILRPCKAIHWMNEFEPSDFTAVFAETQSIWPTQHERLRNECTRFVEKGFSTEAAIRDIAAFYQGHPLREEIAIKRAA